MQKCDAPRLRYVMEITIGFFKQRLKGIRPVFVCGYTGNRIDFDCDSKEYIVRRRAQKMEDAEFKGGQAIQAIKAFKRLQEEVE